MERELRARSSGPVCGGTLRGGALASVCVLGAHHAHWQLLGRTSILAAAHCAVQCSALGRPRTQTPVALAANGWLCARALGRQPARFLWGPFALLCVATAADDLACPSVCPAACLALSLRGRLFATMARTMGPLFAHWIEHVCR